MIHKKWNCIALAAMCLATAAHAQSKNEVDMAAKIDKLSSELAALKAQVNQLDATNNGASQASAATVFTSYGEMGARFYRHDKARNVADLTRFVFGFQHRFNEQTKVVAEVEVEHAVSSADDAGEVAVEQAYIERQLSPQWAARAGLFVMPMGLLNENHAPTAYYGVERNLVETAIVPSTWREGGLQFVGELNDGLTLQAGVSTGFDLSKWDATDAEALESPLGAVHQEMSQARSRNLAGFAALNWRGIPGLQLGGAIFSGTGSQGQTPGKMGVTLYDIHARYTPGPWDLSVLFARGQISGTAAFNRMKVGNDYLMPSRFSGAYAQVAYKLWSSGDLTLSPFTRWERFNTAESFADIGAGFTPEATSAERVLTVGANLAIGQGVVVKADVQRYANASASNRLNLGLGWDF